MTPPKPPADVHDAKVRAGRLGYAASPQSQRPPRSSGPRCSRCRRHAPRPEHKTCDRCARRNRPPEAPKSGTRPTVTPPPPKAGTWAPLAPSALVSTLLACAEEADGLGLPGSAQRLYDLAEELVREPTAERVRETGRLIAYAVWRARLEGEDGEAALAIWERALPRGVEVPREDRHGVAVG